MNTRHFVTVVLTAFVLTACDGDKKDEKKEDKKEDKDKKADSSKDDKKKTSAKSKPPGKKKIAKASKKGTSAVKSKQGSGQKVLANKAKATKAPAQAAGGVDCDGAAEGAAWCGSETEVVFCLEGDWYALDCSAVDEFAFCGTDIDSMTVDCYVDADAEELVAAAILEAAVEEAVEEAVVEAVAEAVVEEALDEAEYE